MQPDNGTFHLKILNENVFTWSCFGFFSFSFPLLYPSYFSKRSKNLKETHTMTHIQAAWTISLHSSTGELFFNSEKLHSLRISSKPNISSNNLCMHLRITARNRTCTASVNFIVLGRWWWFKTELKEINTEHKQCSTFDVEPPFSSSAWEFCLHVGSQQSHTSAPSY